MNDERPAWAARLREHRRQRCWSQTDMAKALANAADARLRPHLPVRASLARMIREWEAGRAEPRDPYPVLYARALGVSEADLFDQAPPAIPPEDAERLSYVIESPRRLDHGAMTALADVLAAQRRAEDAIGSVPLLGPVTAQLGLVEQLVIEARGALRRPMLDVGAQWAQFAGWLHANSNRTTEADRWYDRALVWATEADHGGMIATALSMKGHLGWITSYVGPLIGLSEAAQRTPGASVGVRALAAQQEARGHALAGESEPTMRKLDEAVRLALAAAERPEDEPPWVYFYGLDYLEMQRGLALRLLGHHQDAVEVIQRGLDRLPEALRRSEWAGQYLLHIADAHAAMGDLAQARAVAQEVEGIAGVTASSRLLARLRRLEARTRP
ncbi:XRE family transcriptional regulator [Nonomuraea sp. SMC257]|uniref:XRE family transcriptional regulator n=1 Tax=Nonomuraea montanisoli TaxID=2741721 RepID=A0A7Y6IAK5_9ACTN|nr:XRE family transcriptional regulator [Nonomuraea montanisoli]NUW33414.1 XRE family transcriptional regulator [Nonomuraea montanisoli]